MAPHHLRRVYHCWIGSACLAIGFMAANPTPAHAVFITGTVNVQPFVIGDANDNICSEFDPFLPSCDPALITFSLHLNRPSSFQYSFDWTSGPPDNLHVFGDSNVLSDFEQIFGKAQFVTRTFSNNWNGTDLTVDLEIRGEDFVKDQSLVVTQIMRFNTVPGSQGEWLETAIDGAEGGLFADFTTISSDLTVVPEPKPVLLMLTAFAAFFGIARLGRRRLALARTKSARGVVALRGAEATHPITLK